MVFVEPCVLPTHLLIVGVFLQGSLDSGSVPHQEVLEVGGVQLVVGDSEIVQVELSVPVLPEHFLDMREIGGLIVDPKVIVRFLLFEDLRGNHHSGINGIPRFQTIRIDDPRSEQKAVALSDVSYCNAAADKDALIVDQDYLRLSEMQQLLKNRPSLWLALVPNWDSDDTEVREVAEVLRWDTARAAWESVGVDNLFEYPKRLGNVAGGFILNQLLEAQNIGVGHQ